jgi:hypothetical protein
MAVSLKKKGPYTLSLPRAQKMFTFGLWRTCLLLIYIFMLVLAIDDTLTSSILLISKNFLTQIQRIR